jgi:predicted ATPase
LRTIADIVRRLDGMPLAIELAAGRLSTFSVTDLRDRLDRSLDLLGSGGSTGDPRHRTLRATLEWSYQLLGEDERRLFRHLSVFVDGVDLDTAERVGAELGLTSDPGHALARLVDASMVEASFARDTRYGMLETLRALGRDRLAATGEEEAARTRLVRWAVELTAEAEATAATTRAPTGSPAPGWSWRPTTPGRGGACCRCRWPHWPVGRTPRWSSTASPPPRSTAGRRRASASPRSPRRTPATWTGRGR